MSNVNTATFKAQLPQGVRLEVVNDANGCTLIASADAGTFKAAQALLAEGFTVVQTAWAQATA
jgi:hypothetical protein